MEAVLDRLIVSEPGYRGGRPRIAGTRITVADVAIWHLRWGMTPVEIAGHYDLSLGSVHAALAYYFENREAIDARIAADEAFVAEYIAAHPDTLLSRIRQFTSE